ncbi:Asp23/Gls24 family envelope stress response protein [Streptomyces pathocidini]|uniref:Asp23/Gls24 family envelope stress response protein n=1 Tax=Streptomyces pathocidini TaxID=1650571 RepID=A0ABW7V2E4_9ACTN|nr:Asp23/Gls24 family envelope stress response protein [Streptomyces pathocidini]
MSVQASGEAVPAPPGAVPAGLRGALRIADRVVAKLASQAAREALRDGPEADRVPENRRQPRANVTVRKSPRHGGTLPPLGEARVRISVELGYPSDVGAQCGAVRRQVAERVRELAGMDVPQVSVTVERLHSAQTRRADEVRVR